MNTTRIIIYPKDVQRITGRSERSVRSMMSRIRKQYNKTKHQPSPSPSSVPTWVSTKKKQNKLSLAELLKNVTTQIFRVIQKWIGQSRVAK